MKKLFSILCVFTATLMLGGCNPVERPEPSGGNTLFEKGVYVLCEGGYMMGNASLWFYEPEHQTLLPDIFSAANDASLGDTGQSIAILGEKMFIVMNGSKVVYVVDSHTCEYIGQIAGLTSPRYIAFSQDGTKGYLSQMYTNRITVFNPETLQVSGEIVLEGVADVEQMAVCGNNLFAAAWSNGHKVAVIDTTTNTQIKTIEVGVQPYSIALDNTKTLWVVCDGGNEWSSLPEGVTMEAPSLWRINATTFQAQKFHTFTAGSYFRSRLALDKEGATLYFISDALWAMDVTSSTFPTTPLMNVEGYGVYGMDICPFSGDIYIADAKDYVSNGVVYRYSRAGELLDEFEVGLLPSKFAFVGEK